MTEPEKPRLMFLRSQKNAIFTGIQEKGFSPSDFTLSEQWSEFETFKLLTVNHKSSIDLYFKASIGKVGRDYAVSYCPGPSHRIKETAEGLSWPRVLEHLKVWLNLLADEIEKPDLWATTPLIQFAADQENQPFSAVEQLQIKKAVDEIKAYLIKNHNLSDSRLVAIEERLKYLDESASRMGRKDWLHVAIGVLANIGTSIALGGNETNELFRFAGQVFKQFLGTILYLAGPH